MSTTEKEAFGSGSRVPWASSNLGSNPEIALEGFQKGLTINLIATERAQLETCCANEELSVVVERNRHNKFDFLPVTETLTSEKISPQRIVGLIELNPYRGGPIDGSVGNGMRPLSEENLIAADASILDFVLDADRQQCRLIVSGSSITGLVSLSDLQRLPVRAALFAIVTQLEITMASHIRKAFGEGDGWMRLLSPERLKALRRDLRKSKSGDAYVDALLFTRFSDKVTIINTRSTFPTEPDSFEYAMRRAQSLRNDLAHANDYASTRETACKVCETVRMTTKWIERLTKGPGLDSSR